jgi:hypothetical protein
MENQILSIENKVGYAVYPGCVTNSATCAILRLAHEADERLFLCNMKPDKPVTSLTDGFQAGIAMTSERRGPRETTAGGLLTMASGLLGARMQRANPSVRNPTPAFITARGT